MYVIFVFTTRVLKRLQLAASGEQLQSKLKRCAATDIYTERSFHEITAAL